MSLNIVVDMPFDIDEVSKRVEDGSKARAGTVVGLVVIRIQLRPLLERVVVCVEEVHLFGK